MKICLLASGSKGNALYVETRETRLLIDAGISLRGLRERLALIGVEASSLHGILLSHEHDDHSRGLGPIARSLKIPVSIESRTLAALSETTLGKVPLLNEFAAGETIDFRDVRIATLPLTHDAVATVGFVVEGSEGKVGVATDLGIATRLVAQRLQGCRVLVLEFNHDEELLRDGPYPWPLKQRIRSNHGHLSNPAAAELLDGLLWEGLEAVFLAHLSETNNTPRHALDAARSVLDRQDRCRPAVMIGQQLQPSFCYSTMA